MSEQQMPEALMIHPALMNKLRWFQADHLPEGPIRWTSEAFADLADELVRRLHDSPAADQVLDGLVALLQAKDAFVRAAVAVTQAPAMQEATFVGGPLNGESRQVPSTPFPERIPVDNAGPYQGYYLLDGESIESPDRVPTYTWIPQLVQA